MWSTWVKGATLLLLVGALVEARKEGCTCGGLGSGTNPCSCDEVVVKAAKLPKPIQYASPQVINEAATIRGCETPNYAAALQVNSASNSQSGVFVNANSQSSSLASASVVYGAVPSDVASISSSADDNSDCGCSGTKTSSSQRPLQVQELLALNPNAKIVPNFSPVGDLCTSGKHSLDLKMDTRVKVTPAYPGKLKCCEGTPYEECVKIIQGIRGGPSRMIDISSGSYNGNFGSNANFGNYGAFESNSKFGNNVHFGNNGNSGSSFGTSIGQTQSNIVSGTYGTDGSVSYDSSSFFEGSFPGQPFQNQPLDRLPADPISLSLAYKNIVAPVIHYKKGKQPITEGGLAFGHRTIPNEIKNEKKTPDIPEERLLTVDKPVVELKLTPTNPLMMGDSNDDEEDLAQLEAMEQENLEQKDQINRVTSSFLSYGDVGYGPIDTTVSRPIVTINPSAVNGGNGGQNSAISGGCSGPGCSEGGYGSEPACGPLGPPLEDYVPGNVVVQQGYVETEEPRESGDESYNDDASVGSDEDAEDGPGSGIIARLRSSARNYGKSRSCAR